MLITVLLLAGVAGYLSWQVFGRASAARAPTPAVADTAGHDALTGLPNHLLLDDRTCQAIAVAQRRGQKLAVLLLDLDGIKRISASLGDPICDRLLQSVARRLVACVRRSDTISREGGQFIALLAEVGQPEDAAIAARRMLEAVSVAHSTDHHDLRVTAKVGISVYPEDGEDTRTLVRNAYAAMRRARENGGQCYRFFEPAINLRAVHRQSIECDLQLALDRHQFALHYQPKINLTTGAITGAEALLRWMHPSGRLIARSEFIPVAEACGLILPIGAWVLRQACGQARVCADAGLPVATMAVNVSAAQFWSKSFIAGLDAILCETGLDPGLLELELTEKVLMEHAEAAISTLRTLKERGVRLAVDNLGRGYSRLGQLRRFPVDALKIDQSLVHQIDTPDKGPTIVGALIDIARDLQLRVVAEGVETPDELEFLLAHHCDEAQGHYFSRPVPSAQFTGLLGSIPDPFILAQRPLLAS